MCTVNLQCQLQHHLVNNVIAGSMLMLSSTTCVELMQGKEQELEAVTTTLEARISQEFLSVLLTSILVDVVHAALEVVVLIPTMMPTRCVSVLSC